MTRKDIRTTIRSLLDDITEPYFFSDTELNFYIQEAIEEIAKRTLCIKDSITPSYCSIELVADQIHYPYPDGVLEIDSLRRSWDSRVLHRTTYYDVLNSNPLWESSTCEPAKFFTDFSIDTISLVGKLSSVTSETLHATVRRLPAKLTSDTSVPDLPSRFHSKTFNWILYRCFTKQDAEVYNPAKAEHHLMMFEGTPSQLGNGGDIQQIIMQTNQFQPHASRVRFF